MSDLIESALSIIREGTLPVMLPLIACSIGIWILIVERSWYLFDTGFLFFWPPARRRGLAVKRDVARRFDAFLEEPTEDRRVELVTACERHRSSYHSFLIDALGRASGRSEPAADLRLKTAVLSEELHMERGLRILSTLAKVAPLLGLLGTVTGMIKTFQMMMVSTSNDPRALSAGISIALIATEVGLVVSMPGIVGVSWLSRRAQVIQEEIRLASMRILQAITPERGVVS